MKESRFLTIVISIMLLFSGGSIGLAHEQVVVIPLTNASKVNELKDDIELIKRGWGTVVSKTGRVWMDRNLGALRVAINPFDEYSFGSKYQWGRWSDGHESLLSTYVDNRNSNSDTAEYGWFITEDTDPFDWRVPQNHYLWQGVNGTNNPCPTGFRLPTQEEWQDEVDIWTSQNIEGAFNSALKLPRAGDRSKSGTVYLYAYGRYWSSTTLNAKAYNLIFTRTNCLIISGDRVVGASVRCIKN